LSIAFGTQVETFEKPERPGRRNVRCRFLLRISFKTFRSLFYFSGMIKSLRKYSIIPGFAFSITESGFTRILHFGPKMKKYGCAGAVRRRPANSVAA
jgi:hypothetical protein